MFVSASNANAVSEANGNVTDSVNDHVTPTDNSSLMLLARIKASRVSLGLAALGFAPLLGLFFIASWDRPAYQFFPLALAGAAALAWRALSLAQPKADDRRSMIDGGRSKLGGTEGSQSSAILHPPSSILASAPRAPAPRAPEPRAGGLAAPERSLGGLTSDLRSPISAHPSSLNYPPSSILATAPSTPEPAVGGLASPKARVGGPSSILHPLSSILPAALALWALTVALSTEAWFRSHEARGHDALSWTAQWPTTNPTLRTNAIPPMALRMLQCDENSSANWSDDAGVFWQAFCLRWLPADTFYGRTKVALSKSHNPTICLTAAGMTLKTQLDPVTLPVRTDPDTGLGLNLNLSLTFDRFVFEANGRDLFVFFSQTEDMTDAGQANLRTTHLARLRAALTGSRNYGERNFEVALTGPAPPPDTQSSSFSMLYGRDDCMEPMARPTGSRPANSTMAFVADAPAAMQ